jgi:hypothetical protein
LPILIDGSRRGKIADVQNAQIYRAFPTATDDSRQ